LGNNEVVSIVIQAHVDHVARIELNWTCSDKSSAVAEMGDHLATIDMGRKLGGCCAPFCQWELGPPSNTMSPGPRPTSIPSGILIHPAVWPQ